MWSALLFAIVLAAAGLFLWRLAWRYLRLRRAMRGWPRAAAEVLGYRSAPSRSSRRIDVRVRYQYDGRAYDVWCRSPTRSAYGRGDVQAERQMAARFPRGTSHQVFVNPATPDQAFLELPEPHMLAFIIGGGALLMAFAFATVTPVFFEVDQEIVTLVFFLAVAIVLAPMAVFAAIALWRLPRP
jgi:hypothetical protein